MSSDRFNTNDRMNTNEEFLTPKSFNFLQKEVNEELVIK